MRSLLSAFWVAVYFSSTSIRCNTPQTPALRISPQFTVIVSALCFPLYPMENSIKLDVSFVLVNILLFN